MLPVRFYVLTGAGSKPWSGSQVSALTGEVDHRLLDTLYIPHTMTQYLLFINRVTHQSYIAVVVTAVLAGVPPSADPDPFSEPLADAHSELQSAFDEHISRNNCHIINADSGDVDCNSAQVVKIADSLVT